MDNLKLAEKYAKQIQEKISEGKNGNDYLMAYAEEMSKQTRNSYVDCKVMIRFCFDGFVYQG